MHLVYGVCLKYLRDREDCQDAASQIFEKLIEELKKHEVNNFKSWLHVLTKNYCLMQIRSKKVDPNQPMENSEDHFMEYSMSVHHDEEDEIETDMKALNGCMKELSKEQKKCVSLFYLEEMSYFQVAESSGFELKKVKSYIQNGKRNLKQCIERNAT
ncbi:MAG: sigma-70 family RNA polymerase sigma factor [Reichenbachiella sp.]